MRHHLREATRLSLSPTEKASYQNAVSLFFGALLGALLGPYLAASFVDYLLMIVALVGVVMALQVFTRAETRIYGTTQLALAGVIIVMSYKVGILEPPGVPAGTGAKIAATLGVWLAAVLMIQLSPTRTGSTAEPPHGG